MSEGHDPFTVEEVKARRDAIIKRNEIRKAGDIQRVVNTVEGRRFMWRILTETKVFNSCFDTNALAMAANEGRRDIGLFIMQEIMKAAPEMMAQMQSEAASDRLSREAELLKADKGETKNG